MGLDMVDDQWSEEDEILGLPVLRPSHSSLVVGLPALGARQLFIIPLSIERLVHCH